MIISCSTVTTIYAPFDADATRELIKTDPLHRSVGLIQNAIGYYFQNTPEKQYPWFYQSAVNGYFWGQNNLGNSYLISDPVKYYEQAHFWYNTTLDQKPNFDFKSACISLLYKSFNLGIIFYFHFFFLF
mgnify:CR=1 FL=1